MLLLVLLFLSGGRLLLGVNVVGEDGIGEGKFGQRRWVGGGGGVEGGLGNGHDQRVNVELGP